MLEYPLILLLTTMVTLYRRPQFMFCDVFSGTELCMAGVVGSDNKTAECHRIACKYNVLGEENISMELLFAQIFNCGYP